MLETCVTFKRAHSYQKIDSARLAPELKKLNLNLK
jgi:hypothetical protein